MPTEENRHQTMEERLENAEESFDQALDSLRAVAAQSKDLADRLTNAKEEDDDYDEDSLVVEMKSLQRRARSTSRSAVMMTPPTGETKGS